MTEITSIISAFSADQVVKLTGLTMRQLAYWDGLGFFQPEFAADDRRLPYSRIYSFKDVVGLRTLGILKNIYRCSLSHLKNVAEELSRYSQTPWADLTLYVWNRKVQFSEPDSGRMRGVVDMQYQLLPIRSVMEDVRRHAEQLQARDPEKIGKIEQQKYIAHHADVISGTRIRVSTIRHFLDAGYATDDILKEYPSLTRRDVEVVREADKDGIAA